MSHRLSIWAVVFAGLLSVSCGDDPAEAEVTKLGSVAGRVRATLPLPVLPTRPITKDESVCGTEDRPALEVSAQESGELANVVFALEAAPGTPALGITVGVTELTYAGCEIEPHVVAMSVGSTLGILNADPILHNCHALLGDETEFNIVFPTMGTRRERTIDRVGPLRLRCNFGHPWESARLYVHTNDKVAVSSSDGSFVLPDVPVGSYILTAWHEYYGSRQIPVDVGVSQVSQIDLTF